MSIDKVDYFDIERRSNSFVLNIINVIQKILIEIVKWVNYADIQISSYQVCVFGLVKANVINLTELTGEC